MKKSDGKTRRPKKPVVARVASKPSQGASEMLCPELVLNNISDNIIRLDLQNRVIWANQAAVRSLGRKPEEILGQQCYKLWGRAASDCTDCPTVLARTTGITQSKEMSSKDGRIWQVSSHPIKDEKGKVVSVVEVSRDITEGMKTREREARYLREKGAISDIAMQLAKTSDEDQIFKLISQGIQKLAGDSVSVVSSFDNADASLTVREIAGSPPSLKKINEALGKRAGLLRFRDIPAKIIREFRQGRLILLRSGLNEAAFGELPDRVINLLTKALGIERVYGMGLSCGQNILGAVTICCLGKEAVLDQALIENFLNQASMALNRVRAEKEIKYSQDYFQAIIENVSEVITILDPEGIIKFKSESVSRELGYEPQELIGKNVFDYVHPEDVPGLIVKLNRGSQNAGEIQKLQLRFRHKNGSWQTLEATSINLIKNPTVKGVVISSRNVTEKKKNEQWVKQSEQRLKENEEKYRELADSLPQAIFETDRSGTLTYVNRAAYQQFGYQPTDIEESLNIFQVLVPEDRNRAKDNFNRRAQGGPAENQEYVALKKSGERMNINIYATPIIREGMCQGFRGVVMDITERKRTNQELLKTQLRMKQLLTASPAVIYSVMPEKDFQLTFISENVSNILGYYTSDFFKEDHFWTERIHPDDLAKFKSDEKLLLRQGYAIFEYRFRLKDGSYRWVRDGMQIIYDARGNPSEGIGYLVDITDLKRIEESLVSERDLVKSIFGSSPDALIVSDLEGRIRDCNNAALRMLEADSVETAAKLNIQDMVENVSRERFSEIKKIILKDGTFRDLSFILSGLKGGRFQTEATIGLVKKDQDGTSFMVSTIRDVGERRRMEQALKESEEKHRLLLDSIHSPILALDREMRVLYCNQGYFNIIGRETRDLVGKKLLDVYPSFKKTKSYQAYQKCLETGDLQQVDGRFNNRYLRVSVYPTKWGLLAVAEDATESRLAQDQLEESRRKLETLMGNLPGMVYRCRNDKDWTMEITNQGCLELTGYLPEQIVNNAEISFYQLINQMDREMVWDNIQSSVKSKNPYQLIYRITARDGTEKWVWEQGQGVYDENGELQALEGFITDISDRKKAEDALNSSEYQYRSTIDSLGDSIHVVGQDLNILLTNRVFAEWNKKMGLSTQAIGQSIFEVYPYLPKERVVAEYNDVFKTGKLLITEEENHINRQRVVTETRKIPIVEEGKVARVITVVRDITERKLSEEALRETEARLGMLSDNLPHGLVYQIDSGPDGQQRRFTYISAGVEKLHGVTAAEVLKDAKAIYGQVIKEDRKMLAEREAEAMANMSSFNAEVRIRMPSDEIRWSLFISSPRRLSNNNLVWDGLEIDITESILAREKLKESEANYRQIFDGVAEGIYRSTPEGKVLLVNPALARMLGYPSVEELMKRDIKREGYNDPESRKLFLQQIEKDGRVNDLISEWRRRDGTAITVKENAHVVSDSAGKTIYYEGTVEDITDRKRAEDSLRSSEYQYRTTIDSMGDAIHVVDRNLKIILSNQIFIQWCQDLNLGSEVLGQGVFDVCPFLDDKVRGEYQSVFRNKKLLITQENNRIGDRDIITETRKIPVFEGEEVIRVITVIRDVTEQKLAEQAVKQSEQRYKALADSSPDLVFVVDKEARIKYANDRAASVVGFSGDQAAGHSITEFFPQFMNDTQRKELSEVFETGRPAHYELATPVNNQVMWLETWLVPLADDSGTVKEVMVVCRDLTERIGMENALKESEAKYRQIFEGISEGIYRSTPDGKLLFANPSLIRMLGYKNPEDVQGIDLNTTVYLDRATREKFIKEIERNGEVIGFEAEMVNRDGSVLMVSENARLVKDENGKPLYYEGTLEDVTVKKKAEQALKDEKGKLEHLFRVGLSVAKAQTLQEKMDLTIKGIADCRLFRKAVIVLEDTNGYRSHVSQYGLRAEEVADIERSPVNDAKHKAKIFLGQYRISNSYFIPHGDAEVHKYFAVRFVNSNYKSNGTWHNEDVLIVPLVIKGVNVGYLSVDEPYDGNIPGLETVHLLELFANQAAIAIENIRLYNDLERSYYDTLKAFVAAMDAKDPYTKGHSENVRHYALKIARHIGLSEERIKLIDYSSLLHDIGKLGIREDILAKPDVLSSSEFQEVKLHPVIGSRLVLEIDALSQTGDIIYCHHEYFDGSGYPRGIKGDDIPLESRIIAVADAFEAMTSDRPYRKAFSFQVALQRLQDASGTQFDHQIVRAFAELFQKESGLGEGK